MMSKWWFNCYKIVSTLNTVCIEIFFVITGQCQLEQTGYKQYFTLKMLKKTCVKQRRSNKCTCLSTWGWIRTTRDFEGVSGNYWSRGFYFMFINGNDNLYILKEITHDDLKSEEFFILLFFYSYRV